MKKTIYFAAILAVMGVLAFVGGAAAQNTANWMEQGGATWHIGSGGDTKTGTFDIWIGG